MAEISDQKNLQGLDLAEWMKVQSNLLNFFLKMTPTSPAKEGRSRTEEAWETALKMLKTASAALTEPASVSAMAKGFNALPDIMMKLAQSAWQASLLMQNRFIERVAKIGEKKEAFKFDQIDQEMYQAWTEIYREEFQRFFQVPQLGLSRFYQERINHLIDQYNLLQAGIAEFFNILYLPFERSFKVMEEKLESMAKEGNIPNNSKEYYQMWIRILEGHYMALFKSPEYTKSFSNTISRLESFLASRNQVISDILQGMPVPTNKEMDDVYKDLYTLKKRVSRLEGKNRDKSSQP
jgi:hypothetical protein